MRSFLYCIASGRSRGFIPALISTLLFPLSLIYGLVVVFLALFYRGRAVRLPCKVISVGNITLGGTGKTVLVEYIILFLKSNNRKVAILSRGYKGGDEPAMLQKQLIDIPVIVDSDRVRGTFRAAREYRVDTVILDDGFQQWRIKKDLEILLVDASHAFGNKMLIPAGILREGLGTLRRADIIILTKVDMAPGHALTKAILSVRAPDALLCESVHAAQGFYRLGKQEVLLEPEVFKGERAALLSGIADPDYFETLVKGLGINAGLHFSFPDHHFYSEKELKEAASKVKASGISKLITTEKDAARLTALGELECGIEIFVLRIALKITEGEEKFRARLLKLYSF